MDGKWLEVFATGKESSRELAATILIEVAGSGVEETATGLRAYLKEPSPETLKGLEERLASVGWTFHARAFTERNWLEEWKKYIRPVRIKPLYICQSFSTSRVPAGYIPIVIDPSMAFGTGTHPSTKLALKALVWLLSKKERFFEDRVLSLLDVGTGSGILAIAAKKLGAERVVATDIDGLALRVARKNARLNKTPVRITGKPLTEIRGGFSLVVANIIKEVLIHISKGLSQKTRRGGYIVLSGLLQEDEKETVEHFSGLSFSLIRRFTLKEWVAVVMKKG